MDALLEIILELIFEVFGEALFVLLGKVFEKIGASEKAIKIIKIVIYSTIAIALLVLLVFSLIYKKGILVILVISYLVLLLGAYYLIFIFNVVLARPEGSNVIRWIVRVSRYLFMIAFIVVANIELVDPVAKTILVMGSVLGLIIYYCIDYYRIGRYKKTKTEQAV